MRNRVAVIKWPIKSLSSRQLATTARSYQAAEGSPAPTAPSTINRCPIQGHRARSTHAATAIDPADFAGLSAPSVKAWDEVPGPSPLPLLGNTWRFIPYIGGYSVEHLDKVCLSLRERYGKCVRFTGLLGRPDMLFVFDAAEVERVFRGEDAEPHRPSMPSLNYYKHTLRKDFFDINENCAGVIAVHGPAWAAFRTKVSRVALSTSAAAQYTVPVAQVADAFVDRLRKIRTKDMETPADFVNEVHKWSLESLGLIALDTRLGCFEAEEGSESQKLIDAVKTFFLCVGELELRTPWWRIYPTAMFKRYVAALDTILSVTLNHVERALEASRSGESRSLLQDLVAAAGTRVAAVAALDMFLVGIDTTSNAVASTLYQLSLRPAVQEKLYEEISGVLGGRSLAPGDLAHMPYLRACVKEVLRMFPVVIGNGRQLTKDTVICGYNIPKGTSNAVASTLYQLSLRPAVQEKLYEEISGVLGGRSLAPGDLAHMPYLRACVKEVLRMFPVVIGNGRQLTKDTVICGYNIPKGTQVVFQHYVMGNSEEFFSKASEFDPERWLRRSPECTHHAFAALPFGFGRRMCLGRRFAELEIHTVIARIVQAFKMEYHHEPLDYHIHPMYTPNGPIRIKLIDR